MLASSSMQTITRTHPKLRVPAYWTAHSIGQTRRDVSTALRHQESQANVTPPPSRIRNAPWSFTPDFTFQSRHRQSALAKYQVTIADYAENGKVIDCLNICKEIKDQGIRPNIFIYNDLLKAASKDGLHMICEGIIDDMIATGVQPDRQSYHHLIYAKRALESEQMWSVLERMQELNMPPNAQTFSLILERPLLGENIEMAIQYMGKMNAHDIRPELQTAQDIIILAAKLGHARLALEMANKFEAESVRRLDNSVWVNCLISAAENLYAEGVLLAWPKVVTELGITPDEGLCIEVLHTAGRHGLPDIGTDALRVLKVIGAPWQEHHFAPMIEAFCKADRLQDAFGMLHVMRDSGIVPVTETAYPIFDVIKKDIDAIDGSWGMLDKLRAEGKGVDITAINVIIQAIVVFGDIQRAIGAYKSAPDYGVAPNIDTFHLLLSACISVGHRDLGDHLIGEMKEAGFKPDSRTYERLIILCLTQPTYEDAFFYLEEMKGHKFLPTLGIYEAIIRKCVSVGDTRYTLALDEMKQCGYSVSQALTDFIKFGGEPPRNVSDGGRSNPNEDIAEPPPSRHIST